ncbi:XisI protein [Arsenicibacter rosenii]|uniref:XisI protein n=1 Tax=Arsenicibacter rosenii TaxID=1750698 RepID=A0A1S2VNA8_9BACT|nr:XisI protein [Arsenicibacter rosenii]OIN60234.1 XisI protein [Arsenicibacter rosenii]
MDNTLNKYRHAIIEVLTFYANTPSLTIGENQIEEQLILDTERDHYQILTIGWENGKRVYYPVFHVDIRDGKIWIQEDATDFDLVSQLESRGVAKSDIVLGFQPPYKRALSGYAVA